MTTRPTDLSIDEYLRQRLMPVEGSIPHISGIEMYGNSVPVESVGGDLFEYINFLLTIGKMIRSARMKATTPPKLIPPFHSTAASGTLPIEQTKLSIATIGPISGPITFATVGSPVAKTSCQKESGTQAAMA